MIAPLGSWTLTEASATGLPPSAAVTLPVRLPPAGWATTGTAAVRARTSVPSHVPGARAMGTSGDSSGGTGRSGSGEGGAGSWAPIYGRERLECQGNRPPNELPRVAVCAPYDLLTSPWR